MNKTENHFRLLTSKIMLHIHIADSQLLVLFVESFLIGRCAMVYCPVFLGNCLCDSRNVIRQTAYAALEDCRSLHIEKHFSVSFCCLSIE